MWIPDKTLSRLREVADLPDLSGTRYRLLERLARGGMGTVYLAEDSNLARRVALKVLDTPDPSGELETRLLREARILARLEHPGIVPVHDVDRLADGRVFYTMKYVQGERLDRHLQGLASLQDRLRVFLRICETVAFAHARGVLHRDLKPANIMVGAFGEVLVLDWGLAKVKGGNEERAKRSGETEKRGAGEEETGHGAVLGTPGFMAPEQARGEVEATDERSDVYSLGAVLTVLLEGMTAPRPLRAVAARASRETPAERYGAVEELAADVARYLDGLAVSAFPENLWRRLWRLTVRHRVAVLLILSYLLMRVLLFFWTRP